MNEKEFFYSIGRGSLNLNGKFYYGLDYSITDFMNSLEEENKILRENAENNDKVVDKVNWENQLLKKKNQELKDRDLIIAAELTKLQDENKQLKDNRNKLKEWLKEQDIFITELPAFTKEISIEHKIMSKCYENMLDKIEEIEKSLYNEKSN